MVSIRSLKKRIERLKKKLNVDRELFGWLDMDGTYYHNEKQFETEEVFNKYVSEQGYTKVYLLTWCCRDEQSQE